jgi:EAL domain-containing protein (putative c-di-GMP-specific phosphodiesterase class I)
LNDAPPCMLDRLLEPGRLTVVFQPILRRALDGWHLQSFEALVRGPAGTNFESSDVLFEYVRRKRGEVAVDRHCIREILKAALVLGPLTRLSFNVHAVTLESDDRFVDFLQCAMTEFWHDPSRMTVEIVEHSPARCSDQFARNLEALRDRGFSIALDDVGLGDSNYRMILECRPDYFKVDRYLVDGSRNDFYRRAVLRSIVELAGSFGAHVVAEGVENMEDLRTVLDEGCTMIQGFLFGRPGPVAHLGGRTMIARAARLIPTCPAGEPWVSMTDWLSYITTQLIREQAAREGQEPLGTLEETA